MKRPFLLTVGDMYYPCSGDGDWVKCFLTFEEAQAYVTTDQYGNYILNGNTRRTYDWYRIIDLRDWTEDK